MSTSYFRITELFSLFLVLCHIPFAIYHNLWARQSILVLMTLVVSHAQRLYMVGQQLASNSPTANDRQAEDHHDVRAHWVAHLSQTLYPLAVLNSICPIYFVPMGMHKNTIFNHFISKISQWTVDWYTYFWRFGWIDNEVTQCKTESMLAWSIQHNCLWTNYLNKKSNRFLIKLIHEEIEISRKITYWLVVLLEMHWMVHVEYKLNIVYVYIQKYYFGHFFLLYFPFFSNCFTLVVPISMKRRKKRT